jgi:hypothetical protein
MVRRNRELSAMDNLFCLRLHYSDNTARTELQTRQLEKAAGWYCKPTHIKNTDW